MLPREGRLYDLKRESIITNIAIIVKLYAPAMVMVTQDSGGNVETIFSVREKMQKWYHSNAVNLVNEASQSAAYLGALTAACDEFSAVKGGSVCTSQMAAKIKLWKDDDAVDGAVPFDPVTAFPALWEAVFTMSYWSGA